MTWKSMIQEFLRKGDAKQFASVIQAHWIELPRTDKLELFQFLVASGQNQNFLIFFKKELQSSTPVLPWELFFAVAKQSAMKVPDTHILLLTQILATKKVSIPEKPELDDFIHSIQERKRLIFLAKLDKIKQELLTSARIAKSERLHDQHVRYLEQLKKIFPNDSGIQKNLHLRQRSSAENVLSKPRSYQSTRTSENSKEDPEAIALANDWAHQAQSFPAKDDRTRLDLAIMFEQIGFSRLSLGFFDENKLDDRSAWFLFDFMLAAKQYLSLLNHCEVMKVRFADDPKALFSISYFEAQTYWELGEHELAVDLMKSISNLKPHFRSAGELLASWLEEVN